MSYKISISPEEMEQLEPSSFPGKIKVIDNQGFEFLKAISYLRRQKVIGFDTESRPCFSSNQPHYGVSLLQLSGKERAFLFRVKLMGGIPKSLRKILGNKEIIKVGAAVTDDVRGLKKHHDFEPKSFVDLQKMVSKTQQLSNWEADVLSDSQQAYAATDAWICREMYYKLLASEKNPLTPEQMLPNPPKHTENDKDNIKER